MLGNIVAHKFNCFVGNNIFFLVVIDDTEKHTDAFDNGFVGGLEFFAVNGDSTRESFDSVDIREIDSDEFIYVMTPLRP